MSPQNRLIGYASGSCYATRVGTKLGAYSNLGIWLPAKISNNYFNFTLNQKFGYVRRYEVTLKYISYVVIILYFNIILRARLCFWKGSGMRSKTCNTFEPLTYFRRYCYLLLFNVTVSFPALPSTLYSSTKTVIHNHYVKEVQWYSIFRWTICISTGLFI